MWIIAWLAFKSKQCILLDTFKLWKVNLRQRLSWCLFSENVQIIWKKKKVYNTVRCCYSKVLAHAKSTIIHYSNGFTLKCYLNDFNLPISPKLERVRNGVLNDCMLRWHFHCSAQHQFQSLFSWKSNWCILYIKSKLKVTPLCVKGLVGVTSTIMPLVHSGPPFIQFSFFIRS